MESAGVNSLGSNMLSDIQEGGYKEGCKKKFSLHRYIGITRSCASATALGDSRPIKEKKAIITWKVITKEKSACNVLIMPLVSSKACQVAVPPL